MTLNKLYELKQKALLELEEIGNPIEMESWRVRYLGKKSELTGILRGLSRLSLEDRKAVGAVANEVRTIFEENLNKKKLNVQEKQLTVQAKREEIDTQVQEQLIIEYYSR